MNQEKNRELFFDKSLIPIYGTDPIKLEKEKRRYRRVMQEFTRCFGKRESIFFFSAPGRTEIGGNHTDHQHGCVCLLYTSYKRMFFQRCKNADGIRLRMQNNKRLSRQNRSTRMHNRKEEKPSS